MPRRVPRLRPVLLALAALPLAVGTAEVGLRAYDSWTGGRLSRPPVPVDAAVPCPLVRHALPPFARLSAVSPESGETSACRLNSLGLRGPEPALPRPPGTLRVLVLGDGAVLAAHLPRAETFAGRLEPRLSGRAGAPTEVFAAAVPGDCPLLSALRLRRLIGLRPDLVLVAVRPGDVAEDRRYRRDLVVGDDGVPVACPHPALRSPGFDPPPLAAWLDRSLLARTAVRYFAARGGRALLPTDSADRVPDLAVAAALGPVDEMRRVSAGSGATFAVCFLPDGAMSSEADGDAVFDARVRDALAAFCTEHDVPLCDLTAALAGRLAPDGTPTADGHAAAAERLETFLTTRRR